MTLLIHDKKLQEETLPQLFNFKFINQILLSIILLLICINANAQVQNMVWAREGTGTGLDGGNSITVDAAGNVYTTGYFEATADFDGSAATANLTSAGKQDVFISKTDGSGNLIWARCVGGTGDDRGKSIAVDASGNIFVAGNFESTADLDPGLGTAYLTQIIGLASFILKLNSSGNFVWAKQFGGISAGILINEIHLDAGANIFAAGTLYATEDFDPNAGTYNLTAASSDAFILKLTSAGNFAWVRQIKGANINSHIFEDAISLDPTGNIIIIGDISGTFDFDPGPLTANLTTSGIHNCYFVAKYNSSGNYIWAGLTEGILSSSVYSNSFTTDVSGNIYITSVMGLSGGVDFDITAGVNNIATTAGDLNIQKLTPAGNLVWVKKISINSILNVSITKDGLTGLYISGCFWGTRDFDPGATVFNLTSTSPPYAGFLYDCFILKLDTAANFNYAFKYGSRFEDRLEKICVNSSGNIYSTGNYNGEGDFDPGAGVTNLYSNGGSEIFIQKLNNTGSFAWAYGIGGATYHAYVAASKKMENQFFYSTGYFENAFNSSRSCSKGGYDIMITIAAELGNGFNIQYYMGGPGNDAGTGIISDAHYNVYVTGYFESTADFAPTYLDPSYSLTSAGNKDIFILKIDSSRNLAWANRIGGVNDDEPYGINLDNNGNLYVTGYYQGTVDFNPGGGQANQTSAGGLDAFVLKLDTAGNYIWSKSIGGSNNEIGVDITFDGSGNVITTGSFNGTVDFDPSFSTFNITSNGATDAFIQKLNSSGNFVWAKAIGGSSNEAGRCIATDLANNIICAGSYASVTDFNPNAGIYTLTPPNALGEIFLLQLDAAGNFSYAKSMGGTGIDKVTGLTLDNIGNIYTTGSFSGIADLDPRAATVNIVTSNGSRDVFINCYNPTLDTYWVKTLGGTMQDEAVGIAVDDSYNVYTAGNFGGTVDFDPNAGVFNLTAMGANDIFGMKLNQSSPLPVELVSFTATPIDNKKVNCKWATASEINNNYFIVERSKNGNDFESIGLVNGAGTSNSIHNYNFLDEHPYPGISYYRLKQTDINGAFTFSQIVAVKINSSKEIKLYPTVTRNDIFIEAEKGLKNAMIKICSVNGIVQKQINGCTDDSNSTISLEELSPGVYFVSIEIENKMDVFKVVKL